MKKTVFNKHVPWRNVSMRMLFRIWILITQIGILDSRRLRAGSTPKQAVPVRIRRRVICCLGFKYIVIAKHIIKLKVWGLFDRLFTPETPDVCDRSTIQHLIMCSMQFRKELKNWVCCFFHLSLRFFSEYCYVDKSLDTCNVEAEHDRCCKIV